MLRGLYRDPPPPAAGELSTADPLAPLVLFAGRMIAEKQAPLGVAALALARQRIAGLRGEFLGDGPERGAVQAAIEQHGLAACVSAPGIADAEVVDGEMRRAMCVLLPSRREGYGMVVVEASARSTPSVVVAGEDNAATELVEEGVNGVIAPRADAQAIAEAIARVHDGGAAMRESTASWYARNAERLSLESSLRSVLDSYRGAGPAPTSTGSAPSPSARA